ncbi:MAG: ATP-binding protein, partial [Candidatus Limnocylindrales bacterium]
MTDELTPSQAAARIGATTRSVQRWIARGILPARRVGGRWRVASDALDAFVATEARTSAAGGRRTSPSGDIARITAGNAAAIHRLFIANRGEIATRIARTATRLGMAALIPGKDALPVVDLLDADAVVAAARHVGADAIHPGYGFLAESAAFASAVQQAGIVWVGPPSGAIAEMGDKAAARRLAVTLGIPVLPGYDGEDQDDAVLLAAAAAIGAPLIVKPAGGGGGKGMRIVRDLEPSGFGPELAAARRTAASAFGDERLILERLVEGARHVEVQVLFDAVGRGVALGDRDCSIQRRHQKVLEEAPAPDLTDRTRGALAEAALRLAAAVGYRNIGTCEFLVADDGTWYFLEMNTRLQVEHPVTEEVTGRDLVADQLAIAGGATLSDLALDRPAESGRLDPLRPTGATGGHATRGHATCGHAIEVRLYAE